MKSIIILSAFSILVLLVLNQQELRAQEEDEPVILSEKVGEVIDPEERDKFELFQSIKGFKSAILFKKPDGEYVFKITFVDEETGEEKIKQVAHSISDIKRIRAHIDIISRIETDSAVRAEKLPMTGEGIAATQQPGVIVQASHDLLGVVIDSQENVSYHIFGDIEGFTAAKIYKVDGDEFQLHLLRNVAERAQILILDLTFAEFSQMSREIGRRIIESYEENIRFDHAIFPIEQSKWIRDSVNKKLELRDGSQLFVTLKRAQGDTLIVQTLGGLEIPIPDIHVEKVIELRGEVLEGEFVRSDPNTSRLFFSPTGRRLEARTGYFADYFIFFPTMAIGVTDYLSLSGGLSLIPGAESQLLYFAPKLTLRLSPKVGIGTGFLYLAIPEEDDLNLGYAVTTIGGNRSGVTIGTGLPLASDADKNPILLIGGEVQVSNSAKLITENWIFTGHDGIVLFSGGIRFFGEKLAVDLALLSTAESFEDGGFPFFPWVDFSVFFGK